ncbi:tRNA (guanosine(46)-N7)-methyltransferase TrmB [Catenulispora yoronensis]|uniref:tRNA (guanosine(46)-N7)-methyltransferase TrmB n=1 Tax=Catenulispora yoronensis TaxID=450799 RepID=UPI0031D08D7D
MIRTFHPRRGRASTTQADALTRLWPVYGYTIADPHHTYHTPEVAPDGPFDPERLFGRPAPLVLEIGCGMGEATAAMAAADPGRNYLGVDVHTPGLGNLIALAEARGLSNVRVARGDVLFLLRDGIAPGSLAAVHVFFPDPWPKAKHHKRRIIQPDTVALIRDRLAPGGVLHCATDWAEYAEQMLEVLSADPGLRNRFEPSTAPGTAPAATNTPEPATTATTPPALPAYAPRDAVGRPVTGYERRGIRDGRPIADLVFERIGD